MYRNAANRTISCTTSKDTGEKVNIMKAVQPPKEGNTIRKNYERYTSGDGKSYIRNKILRIIGIEDDY